jgi:hypothetical protein
MDRSEGLNEGGYPSPYLPHGRISFDLLIPQGAQKEIYRSIGSRDLLTFTERFRVQILYQHQFPVAVIRLVNPTSEPDPSDAVVVIRELLEREFGRKEQSIIDFYFLGPSPLHADFYLTPSSADAMDSPFLFDVKVEHRRGYDRYDFFFNEMAFEDPDEAMGVLLLDLLSEVDLHYLIVWTKNQKLIAWDKINALTGSLTELYQRRGLTAIVARALNGTRLVNDTFVELANFESSVIFHDNMLRDVHKSVYSSDAPLYLRDAVDGRMADRSTYPTDQVRSLLQLFETRRLSSLELRTVVISAISGGVFGGIVSGLFGGS